MIGTMLGNRYEIMEKIGEGGMAVVYKAKDHKLQRIVATKILKEEYADNEEFVENFKAEATSVASLSDNNIVNIYDVGSQAKINYIVMEYISGKTLKEVINEVKVLDYHEAVDIAVQIAKALDCAHRNNIIHKDIKPHNILVTKDRIVKVTDFGIAKVSDNATIVNSNKVMGSAHYFSPEQAKGGFIDCRTDIYSLGIVIYEMVTGKVPYDAATPVSVAIKHIQEPVIPPKAINFDIPDSLNRLILKAVEKEPSNRYQNAREMLADLKNINNDYSMKPNFNENSKDFTRVMTPVKVEDIKTNKASEPENIEHKSRLNIRDEQKSLNNKKKRIIIGSVATASVICILVIIFFLILPNFQKAPVKDVTIPNILNSTKEDAKKQIEDLKLIYVESQVNSEEAEGTVISCDPTVGTTVKEGTDVTVIISMGPKDSSVPNTVSYSKDTAVNLIKNAGFLVGNIKEEFSDTVDQGNVISQDPLPDSTLKKGNVINLVISKGTETIDLIDLTGKTLDEAKKMFGTNLTFNVINKNIQSWDQKDQIGKIVLQDRPAGPQKIGTVVTVTVNQWDPSMVDIGDYTNVTLDKAIDAITKAGFTYSIVNIADPNLIFNLDSVSIDPQTNPEFYQYYIVETQIPVKPAKLLKGEQIKLIIKIDPKITPDPSATSGTNTTP